ncbi:MAG TPA: hypothetical protein VFZ59_10130 [Verrucomicrobiae bacterium]|nr:hypothetical protein [Verrucomicrobiae bacterium]
MRALILLTIALGGVAILLCIRQASLSNQLKSLRQQNEESLQTQQNLSARLDSAEERLLAPPNQIPGEVGFASGTVNSSAPASARIAALENRVQALQAALSRQPTGPLVPQYDVTNPTPEPEPPTNAAPKRSWGTEQVLGPPDTLTAGDAPTAWASLQPNAGPEWLVLGFDNAVDVAQVRIRETYNAGAISKVTAVVNGAEVVLWEGTAAKAKGIRDFVVPVSGGVQSDSVIVHLDTARVSSWPEIDAVELVGRDGSRQWATSANASSTYAEKSRTASTTEFEGLYRR